jgi:hypothetical protein
MMDKENMFVTTIFLFNSWRDEGGHAEREEYKIVKRQVFAIGYKFMGHYVRFV